MTDKSISMSARNSILSLWKSKGRGSHNENKTPQTGFGLHTLNPRDADAEGMVDIVAIHGLNGHYQTTWTDEKTGVNWLCDRKISKHARVLSFSYNSAVQFSKSVSDIFDFADQLLEGLLAARVSEAELDRPILFVCHSLGGIVFKQALVRVYENERYRELPARISGVLFFGTPHRGSDMAKWASILGAVVKAGSMSSSTNTGIPKDLVPGSRVLQTISRSFIERSRQLKIYSFFETQKMDFMSDVVSMVLSYTLPMRLISIPRLSIGGQQS